MNRIIVSCTTTKKRLRLFNLMLDSMVHQSLPADLILLNLDKEEFLSKRDFEERLGRTLPAPFKVNLTTDLGPYTKLLPALDFLGKSGFLITVDDDVIYSPFLIERLCSFKTRYPEAIIATRARKTAKNIFGKSMSYDLWPPVREFVYDQAIIPLGVGGVCYAKKNLDTDLLLDPASQQICRSNDDLWFRLSSVLKNSPVVVDPAINLDNIPLLHYQGLDQINFLRDIRTSSGRSRRFFRLSWHLLRSYLGVAKSRNDIMWRNSKRYVREQYRFRVLI